MRQLKARRWLLAAAGLVLTACGGGGGDGGSGSDPVAYTLSVTATGNGVVTSSPGAINCGTTCSTSLPEGSSVTLTATPAANHSLQSWGGACTGQASTCTVKLDAAQTVTASFAPVSLGLDVTVAGGGAVRSDPAGIDCGTNCSTRFAINTVVTLTASPAAGQTLQSWGGACSGQTPTCAVTMDVARTVTATFAPTAPPPPPTTYALDVAVTGSGTVSSDPTGIACGSACTASFNAGAAVQLTATPAQGQRFSAWGGACSGTVSTCQVPMDAARSVTASFVAAPPPAPAPAWATAALLETSNDFNVAGTNTFADTDALTAIDASGNALVVWEQSDGTPDGSTRKVFSRLYVAGQGWAPAVVVPGLSASNDSVALVSGQLLVDAGGNFTWVRHDVAARRYSAAGGWSATPLVPSTDVGALVNAQIDASGAVHVLVYGGGELRSNQLPAGSSTWTGWADVAGSDRTSARAGLAVGTGGGLVAVWRERNPGDANYSMKASRWVSGAWQTAVRIEEVLTNVNDTSPALATDASGNAIAAWHQGNSVYVARLNGSTGTWDAPTELDAGQVSSSNQPRIQLVVASDGRAQLVWNSGIFSLKSAAFTPGTGFGTPAPVTSYSSDHFLGMDSSGNALLVYRSVSQWPNPTEAQQNVYARQLPWGGAWSTAALLETGAGDVKDNVPCAMNLAGQAVCIWAQNDLAADNIRNSLWGALRR